MKQKFILSIFLFFIGLTLSAQTIRYVKQGGTGNGTSWANASGDLQEMINASTAGSQIWVAAGTYKPNRKADALSTVTTGNRDNAFVLKEAVKIYGGFAGTETMLEERNLTIQANTSILSGDLDGDDVLTNGISTTIKGNNAYHVVIGAAITNATELNGFTITGGYANMSGNLTINGKSIDKSSGGGVSNDSSSPLFSHLIISGNSVSDNGGGIVNKSSSPLLNNVTISSNTSGQDGGGMSDFNSYPVLINVTISGNAANGSGGGIEDFFSDPLLTNVIISGNTANSVGGGIYVFNSRPVLTNVTISGNTAGESGGGIYNYFQAETKIRNSIVYGNSTNIVSSNGGTAAITYSLVQGMGANTANNNLAGAIDPGFVSPVAQGLNAGGNYRIKANSSLIGKGSSSFFAAGQSPDLSFVTIDPDGNARITGTSVDLGAYQTQGKTQTITVANISKTYGDASFAPGATVSSGLVVSYASADNAIAEAFQDRTDNNNWKLRIKKAGKVKITASQAGGIVYAAAPNSVFELNIAKKPVTVSIKADTKVSKEYDGTTQGSLLASSLELASGNIINNDVVSLSLTSGTVNFADANAGANKKVELAVGNVQLTGAGAGNYVIGNTAAISANVGEITKGTATITLAGLSATYDGTSKSATATTNPAGLSGLSFTYDGSATAPAAAGSYAVVASLNNANYAATNATGTLTITKGTATITLAGLSATYDGTAKSATATTNPAGLTGLSFTYDGKSTAPTAVGSYAVVASLVNNNYAATNATGTLTITKGTATITLAGLSATYDGTAKSATATTNPAGLTGLSFTYDGKSTAPTAAGSYAVVASLNNANYTAANATGTLKIDKAVASISLAAVSATYDGTAKPVTVTTNPVGLRGVTITYDGSSTAPKDAGSYTAIASLNNANYIATNATATVKIAKATADITLSGLSATYDGTAKSVGVTTNPAGLTGLSITYNGSATAPTTAGSYAVVASLNNANYTAANATGTLVIAKATASLMVSDLSATYDGTVKLPTVTTSPAGLSGVAITFDGRSTAPAESSAYVFFVNLNNDNYTVAEVRETFIIRQASASLTLGDLSATYDGTAKSVSVITNPAGLNIVEITYDGSVTVPTAPGSYEVIASLYSPNHSAPDAKGTLTIAKASQTISFPALAKVNTRVAAFEPGATVNTGLPLSYSSSNTAVAEVLQDQSANNQWKIRIIGEGEAIITAAQQGNANYEPASLSRTLTVEPVTLPVSLVSYQAKMESNRVQLSWTTSSEKDNAYFEIQRSLDGVSFQSLTTLKAKENSNANQYYSVYDLNPANGANYYRLVQFDINGEREVLGDRVVNVSIVSPVSVQVYPNPAAEEINLSITGVTAKDAQVIITDLSGRKMHQEIIRLTEGKTVYKLALTNKLVAGPYVINVVGEGLRSAMKLVVLD